jgi:hypothetical protein
MNIAVIDLLGSGYSLSHEVCSRLSKNNHIDFYSCSPRANDYIQHDYNFIRIGDFNTGKIARSVALIGFLVRWGAYCRKYEKVILIWHSILFIDIFVRILSKDVYFLIHNPIRHGQHSINYSDRIRWVIFPRLIFLSAYSLNQFKGFNLQGMMKKTCLLQHPLVDGAAVVNPSEFDNDSYILTFVGAFRHNRGGDILIKTIKTLNIHLEIFSKVSDKQKIILEKDPLITLYNKYLSNYDLQSIFLSNRVFVLPYLTATQSGIFYSLLANDCVFISTSSGDVGEKLKKFDLVGLIFNLESSESLEAALNYIKYNEDEVKVKLKLIKHFVLKTFRDDVDKIFLNKSVRSLK